MKTNEKIILGAMIVVLTTLIIVQFRSVQANYLAGLIPSKRSEKVIEEINALKQDKTRLNEELAKRQAELDSLISDSSGENERVKTLVSNLENYKTFLGLTDVIGEGIYMRIDDGINEGGMESVADIVEHSYLINSIVNELNAAGAEAISVNGQRIVANSAIRKVGAEIVVNGQKIVPPITIMAIGDKNVLYSAVGARFQIVESLRDSGYQVELERREEVKLEKYQNVINWRYAKPVVE